MSKTLQTASGAAEPLATGGEDLLLQICRIVCRPWVMEAPRRVPARAEAEAAREAVAGLMRERHGWPDDRRLDAPPTMEAADQYVGYASADGTPSLLVWVPGCARLTTAEVHGPRMARWARAAGHRWMLATDGVWHHVVDLRTGRCCTILEPELHPGTEVMANALRCGPDLDHRLSGVVAMLDAFETGVENAFCRADPAVVGAAFRDAGVGDHLDLVQDVLLGSVSGRRRRRREMRLAFGAEVGVSPGHGAARGARRTADRAAVRSPSPAAPR